MTLETGSETAEIETPAELDNIESSKPTATEDRGSAIPAPTDIAIDIVVPAISAIVVTYNHERYIRQALDSVLTQKTKFPFEVIVSEDKSTDTTADIVDDYVKRFPGRIRFMRSEVNLRDNEVLLRAIRAAKGRYITFLDGDDYWVSPDKLQTQFDFMEAHPDSAVTYHDVERVTDDGEVVRVMKGLGHRGTIEDLTNGNFLGTCSVMIRCSALPKVPDWIGTMPAADWPLYFLAARSGFIDHIPGLVSRYRIHTESYWASRPLAEQLLMSFCMQVEIEAHLGPDYAPLFARGRRANALHVLTTVLNEPPEIRAPAANDIEERLRQAESEATTVRIHLVEMRARVNEAEAQRAEAEQRTVDTLGRVHDAEVRRLDAEQRAVDAFANLNEKEAQRLEAERRAVDAFANLNEKEAQRLEAEQRAIDAVARVNEKEALRLDIERQTIYVQARLQMTESELASLRSSSQAVAADLGARLSRSEDEKRRIEIALQSAVVEFQSTEAERRNLQTELADRQRRIRRIRRREKYIGIGLGLLIAALVAFILAWRWA
ncbi:glycosyltransferase [Mesorhizobium sp. BR1-1-16]|uniref:glycosyltransferase n=1 Tax=Mesorhizobium sp. BR1-1-16 TaxID=2876653 RepID=UPI001CCFE8FE|nr:glycosyltransferase [Mesorhizobium sp. BR1-1-16]MBZ9937686.1 glycosyltransferase [Mesorhizobium sp. BR1-1-16]